jgi:hypothetical protein
MPRRTSKSPARRKPNGAAPAAPPHLSLQSSTVDDLWQQHALRSVLLLLLALALSKAVGARAVCARVPPAGAEAEETAAPAALAQTFACALGDGRTAELLLAGAVATLMALAVHLLSLVLEPRGCSPLATPAFESRLSFCISLLAAAAVLAG